jgi:pyruvate dehydrogenase E2 component (dihydrolipoamide acetyltransferase)
LATEVKLPQLGQTMEEGTIVDYKVKVGDEVKKGDVIYEVETDKATLEVESPADGVVRQIIAEVGQTLVVGDSVLILGGEGEEVPEGSGDSLKAETAAPAAQAGVAAFAAADVSKLTEPAEAGAEIGPRKTVPLSRLQKITGQRMVQSKREIPCFYLNVKADVTDLVELRARMNEKWDVKLSYNDFIVRAVATGLEKFPVMTGQLDGDSIRPAASIDIGLAIAVPDGLVAPIIRAVNTKDVRQIACESTALVEKARNNKLAHADLEGGCITVSNLGGFGVESFIPIVVPGQCSILGVGRITDTCVPGDGRDSDPSKAVIVVRKLMSMTLSVDHRIANGTYAAQFLDFVRKLLEDTSNFA